MSVAHQIAEILLTSQAVLFNFTKPFTFVSGIASPIYCDHRTLMQSPKLRSTIVRALVDVVKQIPHDVVAGTAVGAIPWCSWIAHELRKPMIYVRQSPKMHGRMNRLEGNLGSGQRVVLIEDLISSGISSAPSVQAIREAGGRIDHCVAITTYALASARERYAQIRCEMSALTSLPVLAACALERGVITNKELSMLLAWHQHPETWRKE